MTVKKSALMPRHRFIKKLLLNLGIGALIMLLSLCIGMFGYHYFEEMSMVDAFLNAAMILSGMGPMSQLNTPEGKIFAGSYALFSGIVFLVVIAIIMAPVVHRFLHTFHMDESE